MRYRISRATRAARLLSSSSPLRSFGITVVAKTIFYAWQSDTDPEANHHFVGQALKSAIAQLNIDLQLLESDAELAFDRDTHGEPGTPAVADTILRKIEEATVFVADLTFATQLEPKRKGMPNANVCIELGYAAGTIGFERIVCVFNEYFGPPERLPFDLVHRQFPVRFNLSPAASSVERESQATLLTRELARRLHTIVTNLGFAATPLRDSIPPHAVRPLEDSSFVAMGPIARTASRDEEGRDNENVFWHHNPSAWLRLIPSIPRSFGRSQLLRLLRSSRVPVHPFGDASRSLIEPNADGVVAIGYDGDLPPAIAMEITQVFDTGEIWGINRMLLEPRQTKPRTLQIQWPAIHFAFVNAVKRYLSLAESVLELALPLTVVLGVSMMNGIPLLRDKSDWYSDPPRPVYSLESSILWQAKIDLWDTSPTALLDPFFEKLLDAFAQDYVDWKVPGERS